MNVRELIELLGTLPPDLPVGYVNVCADNGKEFVVLSEVETVLPIDYGPGYSKPRRLPDGRSVVLS